MKFIIKVTSICPEGAIEQIKYIVCNSDNELEDILSLNNSGAMRYYTLVGVDQGLDKWELEDLVKLNEGWVK